MAEVSVLSACCSSSSICRTCDGRHCYREIPSLSLKTTSPMVASPSEVRRSTSSSGIPRDAVAKFPSCLLSRISVCIITLHCSTGLNRFCSCIVRRCRKYCLPRPWLGSMARREDRCCLRFQGERRSRSCVGPPSMSRQSPQAGLGELPALPQEREKAQANFRLCRRDYRANLG